MNIKASRTTRYLLAVMILFPLSVNADDEAYSIVKFGPVPLMGKMRGEEVIRKNAYMKLDEETRKALESTMDHFLDRSATGHIDLVGVYSSISKEQRNKNELIYHFIHQDNIGNRLRWSILYDNKNQSIKVLYHIDGEKFKDIKLIKDEG